MDVQNNNCIRTLVVDDEQASRDYLIELLQMDPMFQIVGSVGSSRDASHFLTNNQADCVFLDVEMPGINGVGFCRSIETDDLSVVFVTAFDHYAIDAFDVNAIDYITKPIRSDRIRKSLERVKADVFKRRLRDSELGRTTDLPDSDRRITLNAVRGQLVLRASEIQFLESSGNYVKIWVANKPHLIRETLNNLLSSLDSEQLVSVHRRYVVNVKKIRRVARTTSGAAELYLVGDLPTLPVSRSRRQDLEERLAQNLTS